MKEEILCQKPNGEYDCIDVMLMNYLDIGSLQPVYDAEVRWQHIAERLNQETTWTAVSKIMSEESYPLLLGIRQMVREAFFGERENVSTHADG